MMLALWLLAGCVPDRSCMLVRHDGADLSVCLEGDVESPEILLHLPGGPSAVGGWLYTRYGVRQELKRDFLVAALDWRAMGSSKGHFSRERVTIEQFASDVNEVVAVLQATWPDKEVWLHGHSFGGHVGTAALLEGNTADGWISEAGCHDEADNDPFTLERLLNHVPETERLPEIRVPALYLAGDLDFICTAEHAASASETVGGRTALVVYEDGGHDFADQYPARVADDIRAFLRGLD